MPSRSSAQAAVKIPPRYWAPDSPLDGVARAVYAGLLLLAAQCKRDRASVTSHAQPLDDWPCVTLRGLQGEPLTLATICRFLDLERHQVTSALQKLELLGECARSADNAVVLLRFELTQETPSARRKRRQRAARRRDIERDGPLLSVRDSHATSHAPQRDSHAAPPEAARLIGVLAPELQDPPDPQDPTAAAHIAHRWLNSITFRVVTRPAPPPLGKWQAFYSFIGAQPQGDRDRVAGELERCLRDGSLRPHYCTPRHVYDHWQDYLHGTPPGRPPASSSSSSARPQSATADELERDAKLNPAWLTRPAKKDLPS